MGDLVGNDIKNHGENKKHDTGGEEGIVMFTAHRRFTHLSREGAPGITWFAWVVETKCSPESLVFP